MQINRVLLTGALLASAAVAQTSFETAVRPVFQKTCFACHNEQLASGGLDLRQLDKSDSLSSDRETWETILRRLKGGEMPPAGIPKPAGLPAMVTFIEKRFASLDANLKPDPGRVTARHLNRNEYRNTVRDLLGVDFQATLEFPVDDSGDGFDNIGDVLSVSPLLAEKYLAAAEQISARALGLVKLPAKPLSASYADDEHYTEYAPFTGTSGSAHRAGINFIEVKHRIDYDGDYTVEAGLAGNRGADGKPVTFGFWMDGKLLHSEEVPTKPTKTVYFAPYDKREFKVFLPQGVHSFRLGFINDEVGPSLKPVKAFDPKFNKYPQLIGFLGPERPATEPASVKKILICDPASGQECIDRILSTVARRAFRRPPTRAELDGLTKLTATALHDGMSPLESVQVGLEGILVSPAFLFHIERIPAATPAAAVHRVSDLELASRLSYFLWSSMPDDDLLNAAERGTLSKPEVLDAQIARMLSDPRSSALSENFVGQWLEIRNLDSISPDPDKFPVWNVELKEAMRTETNMFFDAVLRGNLPVSELLTARYTYLNETLAKYYGIADVTGPEFRRVEMTTDQRGGILSHGSVLAVSSYPSRTSVVLRGRFILDNILGSPPPPPPPNVPKLDEDSVGVMLSLKQQMEKHRADPVCASCHSKMDPLGFALENYDAIGRWRTDDGKFPVDSTGVLPDGTKLDGPASVRQVLSGKMPQLTQRMLEKMLIYALGRGVESNDRRNVADIMNEWRAKEYWLQSLVYSVAHSLPFQSRREESTKEVSQ